MEQRQTLQNLQNFFYKTQFSSYNKVLPHFRNLISSTFWWMMKSKKILQLCLQKGWLLLCAQPCKCSDDELWPLSLFLEIGRSDKFEAFSILLRCIGWPIPNTLCPGHVTLWQTWASQKSQAYYLKFMFHYFFEL